MPEIKLKDYQDGFIFSKARFPALISAVGTGKTLCGISRMMDLMETYPNNLGIVVRKEFTDLKDSTIKDFELYTGLTVGSNKDCKLPNGSLIMFRHGDEINVLKNINAGAILIEQAEEFDNDETFIFLRDRLRRKEAKVRSLFLIANANGHNWIYKQWVVPHKDKEFECYEATTFDNADNLPKDYIEDLKKMELTHPAHYRRYVLNSHDDADCIDIIIPRQFVDEAVNRQISDTVRDCRICVVSDPARYGDDPTVNSVFKGYKRIYLESYHSKDTMFTAGRLVNLKTEFNASVIAVDVCGLGAGLADRLNELEQNVFEINSGSKFDEIVNNQHCLRELWAKYGLHGQKPEDVKTFLSKRYRNIRAMMWSEAGDKFKNGKPSFDGDEKTKEELSIVKYKTIESNGCLQVESKDELKSPKRLGHSCDFADNFVMGLFAVDYVEFYKPRNIVINRNTDDVVVRSHFKR